MGTPQLQQMSLKDKSFPDIRETPVKASSLTMSSKIVTLKFQGGHNHVRGRDFAE